ncbi:hypothetical protein WJX79_001038 [Trebouxia sp. C0005]|nr:MAG: threonine dehydratase [Trebouxia sp. A1-2]
MAGRHLPSQQQYSRQIAKVNSARSLCVGNLAGRLASHDGASTSGRHHLSESRLQPSRRHFSEQFQCRVVAPGREQETVQIHQSSLDQQSLALQSTKAPICDPESFTLEAGELSGVNKEASQHPDDVFRCSGCSLKECQGPSGCAQMLWRNSLDGYLRQILNARVYDVAEQTPLEQAAGLTDATGNNFLLKREDLQPVFSFKLRGAYNKMATLTPEQRDKGVLCSSAGNHAQGVALAAHKLGCKAVICMPVTTPEIKIEAVRRRGGQVKLVGETYSETQTYAQDTAGQEGRVFVAPYDDPYTIAGQGTIGTEILRQLTTSQLETLHAIFVPVGGGGLIAGIAAYVKALKPEVKIIGVEPSGANAMAISLQKGQRVTLSKVDAFADGVAVKQVGAETFRLCQQLVDGIALVDNRAISAAIKDVFNETRSILEPAGAVAVAGAKAYLNRHGLKEKTVVVITSGANMNFDRLRLVSELADIGALKEAMLATSIPESPGSFRSFIDTALADTNQSVTEFKYRYSAGDQAHILFSVGIKDASELSSLMQRLNDKNMPTQDLSGIEAAQVHLRHLVGGRARSYMGEMPHEKIYQVEFPERPGALKKFLSVLQPQWNITLFHYRRSGNRTSQALLGLQLHPDQQEAFQAVIQELEVDFTFTTLPEDARRVFDMFIQ